MLVAWMLLASGRTELLAGFVSKRGRRFRAYLVKTPGGRIGFEFQARAPRSPAHKAQPAARKVKPAKPATAAEKRRRAA
jgi:DNA topoisomerase-3